MTDRSTIDLESARFNDIRKNLCTIAFSDVRADIEAYWAEAQKPPTLDDDIMRLAGEHFPHMRGDDYGSGFIPVSMCSHTLGRDLISFAHAVRALPVACSPTPETP
jgi:hypothetical protein